MLVLTGLHGSGKSHLSSLIATEYGWSVCIKRELLRQLHADEGGGEDWIVWYRALYALIGPYEVTKKLLRLVPQGDRMVLDSVHSYAEWKAVREIRSKSTLAIVVAPKAVRVARNGPEDPALDIQRIGFWHDDNAGNACLVSESEWCFNGAASSDILRQEFEAFLSNLMHLLVIDSPTFFV